MANNFEAAAFALQCAFPKNKILMDDKGMPSVFVWIPAFRLCDVLSTTSTDIHPAFRVNGKEIAGFYFGKYQTKVYNERAYSLPAEDPTVSQNFDWFASKTKANGTGWHEATVAEWAAVALWCHKRGCEPRGNNNYGKDANESTYDAIPAPGVQDSGKTARVLTGTGPLPWSHNGQMDGIWDMNGNVWEWLLGLRLYKGELHIIADNNAADNSVSTAASSAAWKAIRASDGALITPDGNGTTSGSIKLNVVSGKAVWDTTITDQKDEGSGCSFKDITAGSAVGDAAKLVLIMRSRRMRPITASTSTERPRTSGSLACRWIRWPHTSKPCSPTGAESGGITTTTLCTSMCAPQRVVGKVKRKETEEISWKLSRWLFLQCLHGWQSCAWSAACSSARWLWCAWVTASSWQRLPTNGFAGQKRT